MSLTCDVFEQSKQMALVLGVEVGTIGFLIDEVVHNVISLEHQLLLSWD